MATARSCSGCAQREAQLADVEVDGQAMPAVQYVCAAPTSPHAGQRVEGPEAEGCASFRPADPHEIAPY